MEHKLFDKYACTHTLGCLLLDATLVDDINKPLDRSDFDGERFYRILFVAIYNLVMQGVENVDEFAIDSYLNQYKEQYKVFEDNNGINFIVNAKELASLSNYDYYYHRLRKFSLLRYYEKNHLDTKFIYDTEKAEDDDSEQRKFDEYTEEQIIDLVENELAIIPKSKYCTNSLIKEERAGERMWNIICELQETPDFGFPLASIALNTIARGGRLGKLYLISADSGTGKTRQFIMNACVIAVPYVYDTTEKKFKYTGNCTATTYCGTEGSIEEFITIAAACVAKVDELKILDGTCTEEELERLRIASEYVDSSPLYFTYMDDFNINDIENLCKKYVYQRQIQVFIFDYIQDSLRLTEEIKNGMKEYQRLLIFSTRLKALAERLSIFILSGTQLSLSDSRDAKYKDQRLLAGSKGQGNKIDIGVISSTPNTAEKKKIEALKKHMIGVPEINMLQWCYKARRGKLSKIIIHSHIDLGTMTIKDCFCTDFDFNLIDVDFTKIETVDKAIEDNSKEMTDEDFEEVEESEDKKEIEIKETEIEEKPKKRNFDW